MANLSETPSTPGARGRVWTVPNVLSMYRLAALPVIVAAITGHHRILFASLIVVNFATDILDGILARALHQQTELGARLDSLGDLGTWILALAGLIVFERDFIVAHAVGCGLVVGFYLLAEAVSLVRFRRLISLHLYSTKVAGYAQGIFFATIFFFGFIGAIFYPMVAICVINNVEEIAVLLLLKESRSDARGMWWVLTDRP